MDKIRMKVRLDGIYLIYYRHARICMYILMHNIILKINTSKTDYLTEIIDFKRSSTFYRNFTKFTLLLNNKEFQCILTIAIICLYD